MIVLAEFIGLLLAPNVWRPWRYTVVEIAGHPVESINAVWIDGVGVGRVRAYRYSWTGHDNFRFFRGALNALLITAGAAAFIALAVWAAERLT